MRGGYFLQDDVRNFDGTFFGINNVEATHMDPQQRKLLEVSFECFENAGVKLGNLSGANVGCYVGNFLMDYQFIQTKDSEFMHRYTGTGMGTTILSNRISHVFNLQGEHRKFSSVTHVKWPKEREERYIFMLTLDA